MNGRSIATNGNRTTRLESRLRELADRVRRVERGMLNPFAAVTVGSWKLEEIDGDLVATNVKTGVTRIVARSEEN